MTARATVVDADGRDRGTAEKGELFVVVDEPVHVDYRRYGIVGSDTGYVLMEKLMFVDTVCA